MSPGYLRSAVYGLITVILAPGILSHEYAHLLACRLWSIEVRSDPALNPFEDSASLVHESVDTFGPEFTIATAPLAVNTPLGVLAFTLAGSNSGRLFTLVFLWLGVCFALTAMPSPTDTESLIRRASALPPWIRPAGLLLAVPIRAVTYTAVVTGVFGYVWIFVVYGASNLFFP